MAINPSALRFRPLPRSGARRGPLRGAPWLETIEYPLAPGSYPATGQWLSAFFADDGEEEKDKGRARAARAATGLPPGWHEHAPEALKEGRTTGRPKKTDSERQVAG
ncbi:hypothetical protein NH8B_0401 [Pseudogulbenkiania sp. NH8B]|nr:hypothetical protein NH8B_0401 [Pseudogulbenkiania sp. NH8B]